MHGFVAPENVGGSGVEVAPVGNEPAALAAERDGPGDVGVVFEGVDDVEAVFEEIFQTPEDVDVGALAGIEVEAESWALYDGDVRTVRDESPFKLVDAGSGADGRFMTFLSQHSGEPEGAVEGSHSGDVGVQHYYLHWAILFSDVSSASRSLR